MLEPVSLNQNRFNAPGIAPDPRGIALGKQGAVLFYTIDSLVGWFRILSDEIPLDDLLPSLAIHEVKSSLESLAFLVVLHADTSHLLDRAARVAGLLGALTFTGSQKHFVKYRDAASPLGYDIDALAPEQGDFVLYADNFTQAVRKVREIPFSQLVFRLSPRKLPGDDQKDLDTLWLAIVPGLVRSVLVYLFRNRVQAAATMVEREGGRSAFGDRAGGFPARYLLARVDKLPARMLSLFSSVPGVEVYRPVGEQAIVEVGYRHPLRLESCKTVFDKERFYLFSGRRDAVDVIAGPFDNGRLALVDGERLVALGFEPDAGGERRVAAKPVPPAKITVPLRLVPTTLPPRRVVAALLGWDMVEPLKKLVFLLPPTVLSGCAVAQILEGLLVVGAAGGIEGLPLGEPLYEAAPGVLVPVGLEFLPRVTPEILLDYVGGTDGRKVIFKRGAERPIAVDDATFEPLSRRVLGRIPVEERQRSERAGEPLHAVEAQVVNDPVGLLPLWGYRSDPDA